MTCEVCCATPATERCSDCDTWLCADCRPVHDREAHPPEPDYDYAMEQRRDDARERAR